MRALLSAITLALALVAAALAAKAPTHSETASLRTAVRTYLGVPKSAVARDTKLVSLSVSTVDGRYAAGRLMSKRAGPLQIVIHRSLRSGWSVLAFGRPIGCDTAPKVSPRGSPGRLQAAGRCRVDLQLRPAAEHAEQHRARVRRRQLLLDGARWSSWGTRRATATGVAEANDCVPYCAAGHFHIYEMRATASALGRCGTAPYYDRLVVRYLEDRPTGASKTSSYTLGC